MAAATGRSTGTEATTGVWLRLYMFDAATLLLTTLVVVKFWCSFFDVHSQLLVSALIIAGLAESFGRLASARRRWTRPQTFSATRRFDLFAAILLGTGPWPVADVLGRPGATLFAAVSLPDSLMTATAIAAVGIAFSRLMLVLGRWPAPANTALVRQLTAIPEMHVGNLKLVSW
jgi:hypothetical protein